MTIEDIKSLMKSGDIAGAEAAAQELLEADPDNLRAMMLFGTCQQLLGDDAAFELTHETVREAISRMTLGDNSELADEWAKFDGLHRQLTQPMLVRKGTKVRSAAMEYVVLATLIAAALAVGVWLFGRQILSTFGTLYAGPRYENLYAEPREDTLRQENLTTIDADKEGSANPAE